jgi:hypothetical protein
MKRLALISLVVTLLFINVAKADGALAEKINAYFYCKGNLELTTISTGEKFPSQLFGLKVNIVNNKYNGMTLDVHEDYIFKEIKLKNSTERDYLFSLERYTGHLVILDKLGIEMNDRVFSYVAECKLLEKLF